MKRFRLWPLIIFFFLTATYAFGQAPCNFANTLVPLTAQIWGRPYKRPVPCEVKDQAGVREYLEYLLYEKTPPGRIKGEAYVSKLLGMVPKDYDYEEGLIRLYLGQIGAYYDPDRKIFVMADWISPEGQAGLVVHELTHALQDQYYELSALVDPRIENSDLVLAHSALVEGDATLVAAKYENPNISPPLSVQTPRTFPPLQDNGVPRSLKVIATFPYEFGPKFVLNQDRQRLLSVPPTSSREILHLEHSGFRPMRLSDRELVGERAREVLYRETFGEIELIAILSMFEDQRDVVEKAAAGWRGDRFLLLGSSIENPQEAVWWIAWDNEHEAREFLKLFHSSMEKRTQKVLNFSCQKENDFDDGWNLQVCLENSLLKLNWKKQKKLPALDLEN